MTETHSPDPVLVGGKLTFDFTLSDLGTVPGVFSNLIPANTVFVSASVTNGVYAVTNNALVYTPTTSEGTGDIVFQMVLTPVTAPLITNAAYWLPSTGTVACAVSVIAVTSVRSGPELVVGRADHRSTLLRDGRVLVTGGLVGAGLYPAWMASAEVYNSAEENFTLVGAMNSPRHYHTATLLTNGMVLVAGGEVWTSVATNSADLFDPGSNVFIPTARLGVARASHSATLLPNGDVILAGGAGSSTLIERFSLADGQGQITSAGNLLGPRVGHVAALLPTGEIVFVGGSVGYVGGPPATPFAERFNPDTGISVPVVAEAHPGPAAAVAGGKVLLHGWPVGAALYDLESNQIQAIPSAPAANYGANYLPLSTGEVLITAGLNVFTVSIFNPRTGAFRTSYPVNVSRNCHSAVELADGRVLLTGGYDLIGTMSGEMKTTELYALRLDMDQDGMDDAWEVAHGFDPSRREDAIEDADGDGHTNLQEYLAGTDPRDPASALRFESVQQDGNELRIRFSSVLGKSYRVQRKTEALPDWVNVTESLAGTGRPIEVVDVLSPGATIHMYRVLLLP